MTGERILVIKLSAFGDFIMALGPMQAIRNHHRRAHITLLTTRPYVALAEGCGLFDRIIVDERPKLWQVGRLWRLARRFRDGQFDRVYDLQTSDRSSFYYRLFGRKKPEWSGIAPGCSHPHANPQRDFIHTIDRQRDQLRMAGIEDVPLPDLSFLTGDIARFGLNGAFALLVPGGAAIGPANAGPPITMATWHSGWPRATSRRFLSADRPKPRCSPASSSCARPREIWGGRPALATLPILRAPPCWRWATIPAPCM